MNASDLGNFFLPPTSQFSITSLDEPWYDREDTDTRVLFTLLSDSDLEKILHKLWYSMYVRNLSVALPSRVKKYDPIATEPLGGIPVVKISSDAWLINNPGENIWEDSDSDDIERVAEYLRQLGYLNCVKEIYQLSDEDDMEEEYLPLNREATEGLLSFLSKFDDLGEPMLGPFPKGILSAEWQIASDKHLLVKPLDSKNVSFAFIAPSSSPDGNLRLNGRATIDEVIKILRENEVDRWK